MEKSKGSMQCSQQSDEKLFLQSFGERPKLTVLSMVLTKNNHLGKKLI